MKTKNERISMKGRDFDAKYFAKLLRVAQGLRNKSDFLAMANVPSGFNEYFNEIRTSAPRIVDLRNIANVAENKVTFEELCDACLGIKWIHRNVDFTQDTKYIAKFFAKLGHLEAKTPEYGILYRYEETGKISLKAIKVLTNGHKESMVKLAEACGYPTENNSIKGKLTPYSATKFKNMVFKKIKKLNLTNTNFEKFGITAIDLANVSTGNFSFKPEFELVEKLANALFKDEKPEVLGQFYLTAGHVYHLDRDFDKVTVENVKLNRRVDKAERLKELLLLAIGDRTRSQFANDAGMGFATVQNLLAGRYLPKRMSILKIVAASASPLVTFEELRDLCEIHNVKERFIPDENKRAEYIRFTSSLMKENKLDILHLAEKYGISRITLQSFVHGDNRRPSDKTIRIISENSRYTFEEIYEKVSEYFGEK